MSKFYMILLCSTLASVLVTSATALLFRRSRSSTQSINLVLSFSVGTLLSSAFLGLLPNALAKSEAYPVLATVLVGMLLFFALEKLLIWRHCHLPGCRVHSASGSLIVLGDAIHNLVDGVAIAAAFVASASTGVAVTLAVITHEVPQEIGDFGILMHSGYTWERSFALNNLSAASAPVGAVIGYFTLSAFDRAMPYLLALSAASFIYIGTADLIPGLQREARTRVVLAQCACLLLGIFVIAALRKVMAHL
jgi:zinc and cadmium transporter